jgi:hypothetical protein
VTCGASASPTRDEEIRATDQTALHDSDSRIPGPQELRPGLPTKMKAGARLVISLASTATGGAGSPPEAPRHQSTGKSPNGDDVSRSSDGAFDPAFWLGFLGAPGPART